jgi:hypothetical protein
MGPFQITSMLVSFKFPSSYFAKQQGMTLPSEATIIQVQG